MLFKRETLKKIKNGEVKTAFRRWKRPSVTEGGTLQTVVGLLRINKITPIDLEDITPEESHSAGYENRKELIKQLTNREGDLVKVEFLLEGPDPRLKLRESEISPAEYQELKKRIGKYDSHNLHPGWATRVLSIISESEGKRAQDIADEMNIEKDWLKPNIRKLKSLGLTISLGVGYKISPRGQQYLIMKK